MQFNSEQIAALIDGKVINNKNVEISNFSGVEEAQKSDLTFIESEKYAEHLYTSNAGIIIIPLDMVLDESKNISSVLIRCKHPRMALAKLLSHYKEYIDKKEGISENACISKNAKIGDHCFIGDLAIISDEVSIGNNSRVHEHVYIGQNVTIGNNCVIHPGVRILNDSIIGDHVTIQPNAIIGGDGFGFVPNSENNYFKIAHIGNVILENHVEIGVGTCIDRATMGSTIIKQGVKLDNLIQVAHNVEIGENTVIAAQTGIAGSAKIGKNCMIGGQVGIVGHIEIANGVKIAAQSGVGQSIPEENTIVQGSPAYKIRDYKMSYVGFKKLPTLMKEIDALQKELNQIKSKL